uniref:Replication factor A C-terminal domain-containing protein n=1 Tax=Brassica oleracea var. oleracea TaxID=109376 RepID=A0A0D3A6Y7_BRAOL
MASSDVVVAHSAFDALRLGRSAQFIVGRLLRFWDSKNIKKQGEFMGITLVLLDEKPLIQNLTLRLQNSVIHGFIPSGRSPYYRPLLKAGSVVRVSRFEVARCTNMYKITDHPFVIRFIPQTTIDEVVANAPMINVEKFMIRKFDPLQALANTNLELPDVVGQIPSVQGSDLTAAGVMSRVVVRLMIEPMVVVYLSLWDDAASMFRGLISSGDRTQSVMVVTTVNPKIFGGNLYLNSTPATKFYFDPALQAIVEFTASLNAPLGEAFPCIDTKDGIKKKEVVSIGELNKFITNSDEHNGWSFISCTGCSKKLEKFGSSLRCNRCANPNVTGVIKYRVELVVDDGADNATFVVFDKEMVKLTKQDAAGLTLDEMNGGESEELPQCVRDLAGKEIVFHIRVTPFNFTPSHRTFTVSSILDSISSETFKTTEDEYVQVEGGEASASASKNVKGEANESCPSADGGAEGTRKRLRE